MEDDDRLQAYWSLTAWQGIGIGLRARALRAIDRIGRNLVLLEACRRVLVK